MLYRFGRDGKKHSSSGFCARAGLFIFLAVGIAFATHAATLTMQTNIVGPTPTIVGYNHGHYYPNSNTRDWWRYSGVSGARVFISPGYSEPGAAVSPWGSGVTDQASFSSREASVRANPTNNAYFNWSYFVSRYATPGLIGANEIQPALVCSEMQQLGIQVLVESTASASTFTNMSSWGDKWELWLFYYEQAFYLGSQFNVQRYQMYNEPNSGGPSASDYLIRLQVASDAIQAAIADVNSTYGKSLTALVCAPVTAGSASSSFSSYGGEVVTNRHVNYQGQTNSNFELIQDYDYHQYGSGGAPSSFGSSLATLESEMSTAMSPEPLFPISISEFNVYDGSQFNSLPSTEDTPSNFTAFAAIATSLIQNGISELYCFKLSQTIGSGYPAKNGMLFVDNTNAPYNIGGSTKGGEVWRLINKGLAPGRTMLQYQADAGASGLNVLASHDPAAQRNYLLSVNYTTSSVNLTVDFSGWSVSTNAQIIVEQVDQTFAGSCIVWTNAGTNLTLTLNQPAESVRLYTVSTASQQVVQTYTATAAAQVSDGANRMVNYGATNTAVVVGNNSLNASLRSAGLLKFPLPFINPTNVQMAILTLYANSTSATSNALAYVYGITNNNWLGNTTIWSAAPNLAQIIPAGVAYTNNFVEGIGDMTGGIAGSNSAQLQGEMIAQANPQQVLLDVTGFVKAATTTNISFLLARLNNFYGDDSDGVGFSFASRAYGVSNAPTLSLVYSPTNVIVAPTLNITVVTNALQVTLSPYENGQMYTLQSSATLSNSTWVTVSNATVQPATNGQGTITITNATEAQMFYRLSVQMGP
jgi:hypothetical protein